MTTAETEGRFPAEELVVQRRARAYVLVRVATDLVLLVLALLDGGGEGLFPPYLVVAADLASLLLYAVAVRRWPRISTFASLLFSAAMVIAVDFALGQIVVVTWLFLIPLALVGGMIIARSGFNSLVTLSLLLMFGAYAGLILQDRIPVPLGQPRSLFITLGIAIGLVIIVLNALVETLVVHLFDTQEDLVHTQVELLQMQTELEQSKFEMYDVERQTRRMERLSAIGQIAGQISKSLRAPLSTVQTSLDLPEDRLRQPETIEALRAQIASALRMTDGLQHFASLGRLRVQTVNVDDILATEIGHLSLPDNITLRLDQPPVMAPVQADPGSTQADAASSAGQCRPGHRRSAGHDHGETGAGAGRRTPCRQRYRAWHPPRSDRSHLRTPLYHARARLWPGTGHLPASRAHAWRPHSGAERGGQGHDVHGVPAKRPAPITRRVGHRHGGIAASR